MDPPLVNEASFTAASNPSSCSLAGLLSFSTGSGRGELGFRMAAGRADGSLEESTVTEQSFNRGGRKRWRDAEDSIDEGSSQLVSTSTANQDLSESDLKRMKAYGLTKTEGETNSGTSIKPVEKKSKPEPPKDYIHVRARGVKLPIATVLLKELGKRRSARG